MSAASILHVPGIPSEIAEEVRSGELEERSAEELLGWALERFAPRIALSASFGSPEGMVILDLMHRIAPEKTRVFTIDTGRLPQETYNLIDRVRDRYGLEVEIFFPDPARVEAMVRAHGMNLFYESLARRELCCGVRKVEPLRRALAGLDAWISGLRPTQSVTRRAVRAAEVDGAHGGRLKLNPLVRWSQSDVWTYARAHALPVNALHARGYPTVGCAPCTRPVKEGEDERSGRWWWESAETRECGLHTGTEQDGSGI
jgi:phosphoadenosine phosphosulfate reductase